MNNPDIFPSFLCVCPIRRKRVRAFLGVFVYYLFDKCCDHVPPLLTCLCFLSQSQD
jgi:hypothetical protein